MPSHENISTARRQTALIPWHSIEPVLVAQQLYSLESQRGMKNKWNGWHALMLVNIVGLQYDKASLTEMYRESIYYHSSNLLEGPLSMAWIMALEQAFRYRWIDAWFTLKYNVVISWWCKIYWSNDRGACLGAIASIQLFIIMPACDI